MAGTRTGVAVVLAFSLALLTAGCECIHSTYLFNVDANISPQTDSLSIGDTLWITSSTPTTMLNSRTDENVKFTGARFGIGISVRKLEPNDIKNNETDFDFTISRVPSFMEMPRSRGSLKVIFIRSGTGIMS